MKVGKGVYIEEDKRGDKRMVGKSGKGKEEKKWISVTNLVLEIDLTSSTQTVAICYVYIASLVPRPLPDFILQPWRRFGRRPGPVLSCPVLLLPFNDHTSLIVGSKSCAHSRDGLQLPGGLHVWTARPPLLLNHFLQVWHWAAPLCSLTCLFLSLRHLCLFLSLSSKFPGAHLTFTPPSCCWWMSDLSFCMPLHPTQNCLKSTSRLANS